MSSIFLDFDRPHRQSNSNFLVTLRYYCFNTGNQFIVKEAFQSLKS